MFVDPPKRIGHYEVLKLIHEVGGAAVYMARDSAGGQIVAIAMPPVEEAHIPERREAFRHTAAAMASLNHPNIARVLQVGDHEGTPFLVSEWPEGDTLVTILLRRPQPSVQETLRIMIEALPRTGSSLLRTHP
jgi:serine/threonine protein kinase